jgi:FolB domain-containing protein
VTYPPQGDRIELRGLRMLGVIGVLDHEQAGPQPLEVDIDLELDLSTAGISDDLADTVNYGEVCAQVEAVVERSRFSLLEALAEAIAAEVLDRTSVDALTVTIRKLRPPVPQQLQTSAVRITRRRPQ